MFYRTDLSKQRFNETSNQLSYHDCKKLRFSINFPCNHLSEYQLRLKIKIFMEYAVYIQYFHIFVSLRTAFNEC